MEQEDIGSLLKKINLKIKRHADAALLKQDMTLSQLRVIHFLTHNGGTASQKQIETFFEISHPTTVGLVARLEKSGYVTCHFREDDRRKKMVVLTEKARDLTQKMDEDRKEMEKMITGCLTDDETAKFRRTLEKINRTLDEQLSEDQNLPPMCREMPEESEYYQKR